MAIAPSYGKLRPTPNDLVGGRPNRYTVRRQASDATVADFHNVMCTNQG
jgi:hypothetical protein